MEFLTERNERQSKHMPEIHIALRKVEFVVGRNEVTRGRTMYYQVVYIVYIIIRLHPYLMRAYIKKGFKILQLMFTTLGLV